MQQLPKFYETYIPILKILSDKPELHARKIETEVRDAFYSELPKDLLSQKTPVAGANTLLDRIGWGISFLFNAAYLERPRRAYYKINEKGLRALQKGELNHETVVSQKEYIERQQRQKQKKKQGNSHNNIFVETTTQEERENNEGLTPFDLIDKGIEEIQNKVKEELLENLRNIDPYVFEEIILSLLKAMGYGETEGTAKSGDGGIDGIIYEDKLGLDKIYIQAKRFNENKVRENEIRNFIGAMSGDTSKGIFVSTSSFDEKAKEKARSAHHKIKLIDGDELVTLMYNYNIGVQIKSSIHIKAIDNDFFETV